MSDPRPEDKGLLDRLARAVGDACRAQWTVYHLKGWDDVARAPAELIQEALDSAYRLGYVAAECAHKDDEREQPQ